MKERRGVISVVTVLVITAALWLGSTPAEAIAMLERVQQTLGGVGLVGMSLCFVLAVKTQPVEVWFSGFDRSFVVHKWLAITSAGALLVHAALNEIVAGRGETNLGALGSLALFLVIAGGAITLYVKKLPYERWRWIHRLMGVALILGTYHAYSLSSYPLLKASPLGIWMSAFVALGLISFVYVVFIYRSVHFRHTGTITDVSRIGTDFTEATVTLDEPLRYAHGQYAFLRVFQDGLEDAPHPFSIFGGDGTRVSFTIKVSGDFTRDLYDKVRVGSGVALSPPFGHMDFAHGGPRQLWIAGGIGITPFLSYLKENDLAQDIELFYSFRDKNAGIYADWLAAYAERDPHFSVHLADFSQSGNLDFSDYTLQEGTNIFMCGPLPMMKAYRKYFTEKYSGVKIVNEGFAFR